jgi:hypothetical protein
MSGAVDDDLSVDSTGTGDGADYSREAAYTALQAVYDGDDEAVDTYVAPVDALVADAYTGSLPLDTFEEKFQQALKAYDHRTGGECEPDEDSIYDGLDEQVLKRQKPVTGADIANTFLDADTYEAAKDELERFEQWLTPTLDNTALQFDNNREPLNGEQYQHLVTMHSFRRLIQRKHHNRGADKPERFTAPDNGRNIDLASHL